MITILFQLVQSQTVSMSVATNPEAMRPCLFQTFSIVVWKPPDVQATHDLGHLSA